MDTTECQYLSFVLNGESYAIPIAHVREILAVPRITRIPRMPDFMRGVINLRGSVVPILDLQLKFGVGETAQTPETAIIVIEIPTEFSPSEAETLRIGVFADAVKKVIAIPPDCVEPAPKIGLSVDTSFISGMGKIDGGFTTILNIREILSEKDIAAVESSAEG